MLMEVMLKTFITFIDFFKYISKDIMIIHLI